MANGVISHKIPKLGMTSREDKITETLVTTLSQAIAVLEEAIVNVDNCGNCAPSNCCQSYSCQSASCQWCQTCQGCQSCQSVSCQSCQRCQSQCWR